MKTISPIKTLMFFAAFGGASAYAQYTESKVQVETFAEDAKWSEAAWSDGLPDANTKAVVNSNSDVNYLTLDADTSVANLTLENHAELFIKGTTLTTTASDIGNVYVKDGAGLLMNNGGTLTLASGRSVVFDADASLYVSNGTLNGRINSNSAAKTKWFESASVWNTDSIEGTAWNIQMNASTLKASGNFNMGAGNQSGVDKNLTFDNSSIFDGNGNSINTAGNINILNGSQVVNFNHFNVGRDGGNASGSTTITLRGSASNHLSTLAVTNTWINTQPNASANLVLDGFSHYKSGKIDVDKPFTSGSASIMFSNDNNFLEVTSDVFWGPKVANAASTQNGHWLIATDGSATNSIFKATRLNLNAAGAENNAFKTEVDWSGATNEIQATELKLYTSTASASNAQTLFTVRDSGTATVSSHIDVGTNTNGKSGSAILTVKNGGVLDAKAQLRVFQSLEADSTAATKFVVDAATFNKIGQPISIGGTANTSNWSLVQNNAMSGSASFEVINGGTVDIDKGFWLNLSTEAGSTASSKLLVDSSTFKTSTEVFFGAHSNTVSGGTATIEVTGTNAVFESTNKGLFSGHNATISGGKREILLNGTNNSITFGKSGTETFNMSTSGSAMQTGGSFDVKITGTKNTFQINNIAMGDLKSTGGSNSIYIKGDSAADKNTILFDSGYTLLIRGSQAENSTIENSITMAGNSIITRVDNNTVNIEIGYDGGLKGGTAKLTVTGTGNQIDGEHLRLGNTGSTGGQAVLRIEGYGNQVNFRNGLSFNGGSGTTKSNVIGGKMELVLSNGGLNADTALLNIIATEAGTSGITAFSGILEIDFTKLTGEFESGKFELITSGKDWKSLYDAWVANDDNYGFKFREDGDSAYFEYDNGSLYVIYTSIPEPSALAAIFGTAVLAFAMARRKARARN